MALQSELAARAAADLVGRDAELKAVRDAIGATSGTAGVVLEGEAGIGKTSLWRAGVAGATELGMQLAGARPAEPETTLSHAALGDLLVPLVEEFGSALPEPQRHALDVALLRAEASAPPSDGRAVGAATLTLLRAAAGHAPLLLAIDDMQWLDSASAGALQFALRRLSDERVVVLATIREPAGTDRPDVGIAEERLTRIAVRPLDQDALRRLLRDRLGEGLSWAVLTRLAERSGGNPYYALELGRAALRRDGAGSLTPEGALPDGIHAVLQERLATLPPETRTALGTIAAMGRPTVSVATAVVDSGALDPAFAADVVHEDHGTIRFDHPLLAEAAYRMLQRSEAMAVHERLADLAGDAEERARHLAVAAAEPDAGVAAEVEAGAEAAAARGAVAAAAELLEASARFEPDAETAARRRIRAARHYARAGDGRRAHSLVDALIQELPAGPLRSRALVLRWEQEGPLDEMLAFARQAVEEAGDDDEALLDALLAEGLVLTLQDRYDEAQGPLTRARDICRGDADRRLRVKAMCGYAELASLRGDADAVEILTEAVDLEGDDLIPNAYWSAGALLGRAHMFSDELDEAHVLLESRRRRAIDAGDDESRAGLSLHLAEIAVRQGRLDDAERYAEQGFAIGDSSYGDLAQGTMMYGRALVAAHMGEVELARELGERGLARSEAQADGYFAGANRSTLGFLALSLGDNEAAVEHLWPIADRFMSGPVNPGLAYTITVPDAIEALIGVGRLEDAEEVLVAWERAGARYDRPRLHATAARCRALLAAARGDLDAALAHTGTALDHHRDLPVPLERARTLIVQGSIQRRLKRKAAARESLEDALSVLERIGARVWAHRARAELARISGRSRAAGLTPTEARVAELVADGRSNKQVAGELFVSVRTVEANLTRIYAKLGIRSRTELASRRGD